MGYRGLINRAVKSAFRSVGDLAFEVTLSKKDASSFDFIANEAVMTATTTASIKVVVLKEDEPVSADGVTSKTRTVITPVANIDPLNIYDTITFSDGGVWTITPGFESDGYVITLILTKGV